LGAVATIGGVILLAIGLVMVAGGGGITILSLMSIGGASGMMGSSSSSMWIWGSVLFWIGMAPTVIGIRLVARTGRVDNLEYDVDIIKKHLEEEIKRKSNKEEDTKPDVNSDKNENL